MKELTFKIKQVFMGTRVIENQVKYQILCGVCAFIHLFFVMLFFYGKAYFLLTFNIISVFFYLLVGMIFAAKEKYRILFIMAFFEIELNSAISSVMLGSGYEFMIYTLSLIPGAFYMAHTWPSTSKSKYGISLIPLISTSIIGASYVVVDVLYSIIPATYTGEDMERLKVVFHYFNIMAAVLLLLVFSILSAFEVRYIWKMLNDENSRLGEIAAKDPLTKALNRRSLNELISREMSNDSDIKFGLIILDIDDFKNVNDTYGHNVGDQVLIGIANTIKASIRDNDLLCRWGGEEFLIMVHGSGDDFAVIAERIRKNVETQEFKAEQAVFKVTVTLGASEYQTGLKLRTLIDMADQKLYFGKNHGKNHVVV